MYKKAQIINSISIDLSLEKIRGNMSFYALMLKMEADDAFSKKYKDNLNNETNLDVLKTGDIVNILSRKPQKLSLSGNNYFVFKKDDDGNVGYGVASESDLDFSEA